MFVVSLSSKKLKIISLSVCCFIAVGLMVGIMLYKCSKTDVSNDNLLVNNSASNIDEILAFISNFGWEIRSEPDEIREIIIPVEFDDVYNKYNEIQLSQGYDLREYSGERNNAARQPAAQSAADGCVDRRAACAVSPVQGETKRRCAAWRRACAGSGGKCISGRRAYDADLRFSICAGGGAALCKGQL